ncbi:hypothetical protein [Bacillus sp. V59.32b]|uniref:hypothetical protein n=1 Tax=Bacillus sp. V59.32b TaxID=1758642 RepID=UPI001058699A|nr:hypothetical protein [Bacillus sp. V59.32b]
MKEHIAIKWLPAEHLVSLDWVPADIPSIQKLSSFCKLISWQRIKVTHKVWVAYLFSNICWGLGKKIIQPPLYLNPTLV